MLIYTNILIYANLLIGNHEPDYTQLIGNHEPDYTQPVVLGDLRRGAARHGLDTLRQHRQPLCL
jgi:hypothetical protein